MVFCESLAFFAGRWCLVNSVLVHYSLSCSGVGVPSVDAQAACTFFGDDDMASKTCKPNRREFLCTSTTAAAGLGLLGVPAIRSVLGAGERVRVGFIGVGNRGTQLLQGFMQQKDVVEFSHSLRL